MTTSDLDNNVKKSSVINMRILVRAMTRVLAVLATVLVAMALVAVPQGKSPLPTADAQANPPATAQCGSSVAFVIDLSNSLSSSDVSELKVSLRNIVENLQGAPYNIGLYTFGTNSPFPNLTNVSSTSLRTEAGVDKLFAAIDALYNFADTGNAAGGTNWEGGLEAVANDMATGTHYDVVYFITDGQPTFNNNGNNGHGAAAQQVEIDDAVTQANRIDALGGRIIPVGLNLPNQIEVLRYQSFLIWGQWVVDRTYTAPALLNLISTENNTAIIPEGGYDALADELTANFATGCVQIVKEVVDAEGNVIDAASVDGWNFNLSWENVPVTTPPPASASTDATGTIEIGVPGMTDARPARVTINEVPDASGIHELRQQNGANARCVSYKAGGPSQEVSASNAGLTSVRVTLDPESIIACTFQNEASAPLTLEKRVQINNTQLQQELNNRTYSFSYQCTAAGQTVASGNADIGANAPLEIDATVPVGSECTITETAPDTDPSRFDVTTSWTSQYASGASTSSDGLSFTFTVGEDAYLSSLGAQAIATNTYDAQTATISVRKSIRNRELLPAGSVPSVFEVRYSCRYVADTSNPPEQSEDPTAPYYVAVGTVAVPSDGTPVQIVDDEVPDGFPVGTQCLYEELSPATNPITIDGFNLSTSWNSDMCLENSGDFSGDLSICAANFTWVPAAGNYTVEVVNDYQRQTGAVVLTKALSGEAADSGLGRPFDFTVVCTQDGTEIFSETVTVAGGASSRLPGVPIGADCTATELESSIPGAVNTGLASADFRVTSQTQDTRVTLTNDLAYETVDISVSKVVDADDVVDLSTAADLETRDYSVTASCVAPGQGAPTTLVGTVSDGTSVTLGPIRVGSICTFTEEDPQVEGVDHLAQFAPNSLAVTATGSNEVVLTNTYWTSESSLTIAKSLSVDTSVVSDIEDFVPAQFAIDYTCSSGDSGSVTLAAGESQNVGSFPLGTECTISESVIDEPEIVRVTTFTGPTGTVTGDSITGTFDEAGSGVVVTVANSYTPAFASVDIDKEVSVTNGGTEVSDDVRDALLGTDRSFTGRFECTRAGTAVASGAVELSTVTARTVRVPANSDCDFWENAADNTIANLDGPDVTYSGTTGTEAEGRFTLDSVTGEGNEVVIANAYQVQTGGFNLKKKVDGEGVATIVDTRDYEINYVCTFQDVEVASGTFQIGRFDDASQYQVRDIPVGASCMVTETEDSAAEANAQWEARWTVAAGTTGWEAEQTCSTITGCAESSTGAGEGAAQNVATIDILPNKPAWSNADDYFQGTLVVWNTYTYEKVFLQVDKSLSGDGQALAAGDTFSFDLVCTDPEFANSGLDDLPYVQDPTITQVVSITGEGNGTATTMVPVGYDCTITERQVNAYDAEVNAHFENAATSTGDSADPSVPAGAVAEFAVDPATHSQGETYEISVTNDYQRARAELTLTKTLEGSDQAGNVNAYLNNPDSFDMTYRCEDPYQQDQAYTGTVPVPTDGSAVEVLADDNGTLLPASVICTVSEDVAGQVPAEAQDVVEASHNLTVTRGAETVQLASNRTTTSEFGLDAANTTNVAFANSYRVSQISLGFSKYIEGDPNAEVVDPATTEFDFTYTCTVDNLVGSQPLPEIAPDQVVDGNSVSGGFTLLHGQSWSTGMLPVGSSCQVAEVPNEEFEQQVDDAGLRMSINYVYPDADAEYEEPVGDDENQVQQPIIGDAVRIPLEDGATVPLTEDKPYAWLLNSFFAEEGEVQVHKVNMSGDPLAGASFAIYPVDPDNPEQPGATPIVEDLQFAAERDANGDVVVDAEGNSVPDPTRFVARLEPGTYYLVETKSGTGSELLPSPWRFSVAQLNADDPWSDLKFALSDYDTNSGLITVANSDDGTSPAIIQVANVESGELPLTGDRGVWWTVGAGALLLGLAGLVYLRRRA